MEKHDKSPALNQSASKPRFRIYFSHTTGYYFVYQFPLSKLFGRETWRKFFPTFLIAPSGRSLPYSKPGELVRPSDFFYPETEHPSIQDII